MKKLIIILLLAVLISCMNSQYSNLKPVYLESEPLVNTFTSQEFESKGYKTFSVFPITMYSDSTWINDDSIEGLLLFELRNAVENLGYEFVELDQEPDLLFTLDAAVTYREHYVPPSKITTPVYEPGKTVTVTADEIEQLKYNSSDDKTQSDFDRGPKTSDLSSTYIPPSITYESSTKPGYYSGAFYPQIMLVCHEADSFKVVFSGTGVGVSKYPDLGINSQLVINELLAKGLPPYKYSEGINKQNCSHIGMGIQVLTVDGNNYYPVIINIKKGSAPAKAGLKKDDIITSINGLPTLNIALSKCIKMLAGEANQYMVIGIKRLDEELSYSFLYGK